MKNDLCAALGGYYSSSICVENHQLSMSGYDILFHFELYSVQTLYYLN